MKCYCDKSHGGAGKAVTPYAYHLYLCEFYLDEIEGYSYEKFKRDYYQMKTQNRPGDEIYEYFMNMHTAKNKSKEEEEITITSQSNIKEEEMNNKKG